MSLIERVRRTIRRHGLASRDTRVLAAVSGGSDSVALVHLLRDLEASGELRLTGLAHFNHRLRDSAARDQQLCETIARSLGVPLIADSEDVRARASRERRSIEDAARTARHAFLSHACLESAADVVALGHTRDDQAETFLLRLLRGAGARGLASMYPRHGALIRPLLECRRADLRAYLGERQLTFVDDETNDDVAIPRNRVRAELLPLLERRFNPAAVDVLADAADVAREEWSWMNGEADALAARALRTEGERWTIDADFLSPVPLALVRLVVQRAMIAAARGRPIAFDDVARAVDLVRFGGGAFDAPGQHVERIASQVVLTGRPAGAVGRATVKPPTWTFSRYSLSIPGEVQLSESNCTVSAELAGGGGTVSAIVGSDRRVAVVRLDRCIRGLTVRYRRPGDRFRPVGVGGGKKLQDFFVDRKVDRRRRDSVPLVVDESDRIVWVAGHAIDEEFRVTDTAQAVIILRLKGLGGSV